jgi:hypothetical protein
MVLQRKTEQVGSTGTAPGLYTYTEGPSSNIGRDTEYFKAFGCFVSSSRKMPEYLKLLHDRFFPHPFRFITQVILPLDAEVYSLSDWERRKIKQNK